MFDPCSFTLCLDLQTTFKRRQRFSSLCCIYVPQWTLPCLLACVLIFCQNQKVILNTSALQIDENTNEFLFFMHTFHTQVYYG